MASDSIDEFRNILTSESKPLAVRFRALFALKHHAALNPPAATTIPAIEAIAAALKTPSALLKHELAYCLGQSNNHAAAPFLQMVLRNQNEDPMCRHEAAEALGALGHVDSLTLLRQFCHPTELDVVRETCEIAIDRIEWARAKQNMKEEDQERLKQSDFASIDPAPPLPMIEPTSHTVSEFQQRLLDIKLPLFERYRAMFALRDLASPPDLPTAVDAVHALASGFDDSSALFRHEIAFVFGQLSHPASIPSLSKVLANEAEASMVRHEAAEALGSLGSEEGVEETLRRHINDAEQVVRDSIIVALDMAEFERSGQSDYTLLPAEEHAFSPLASISTGQPLSMQTAINC